MSRLELETFLMLEDSLELCSLAEDSRVLVSLITLTGVVASLADLILTGVDGCSGVCETAGDATAAAAIFNVCVTRATLLRTFQKVMYNGHNPYR